MRVVGFGYDRENDRAGLQARTRQVPGADGTVCSNAVDVTERPVLDLAWAKMDRCMVKMCRRIWVGPLERAQSLPNTAPSRRASQARRASAHEHAKINARPDPLTVEATSESYRQTPSARPASGFDHKADVRLAQLRHESLKVFGKPPRHIGFGRAVERPGMQHDFARAQNVGLLIGPQKRVDRAQDLGRIGAGKNDGKTRGSIT